MAGQTVAERCKRHGSQGDKIVTCVRCKGDIQPYSGRKVAELREVYAHHPGKCADAAERAGTLRKVAQQALFAWECSHTEPGVTEPETCSIAGMGRESAEAFAEHFRREHGATVLKPAVPPIRLRRSARPGAPKFTPVDVRPFKALRWTEHHETRSGDLDSPYGIKVERWTSEHRGQFWSAGESAHCIWAIEDMRAAGLPNRLVELYVHADGSVSRDWSAAASSRREANRQAKRAA